MSHLWWYLLARFWLWDILGDDVIFWNHLKSTFFPGQVGPLDDFDPNTGQYAHLPCKLAGSMSISLEKMFTTRMLFCFSHFFPPYIDCMFALMRYSKTPPNCWTRPCFRHRWERPKGQSAGALQSGKVWCRLMLESVSKCFKVCHCIFWCHFHFGKDHMLEGLTSAESAKSEN